MQKKIYCFDLDGTLCTNTFGEYESALPLKSVINKVNNLFDLGNTIKIYTARGSGSGKDWREQTESQLSLWGVRYHELIFGKPEADLYIDDRSVSVSDWTTTETNNRSVLEYFHLGILEGTYSMLRGTSQLPKIAEAAEAVVTALQSGNKVMWCGNGGSAADSQHLAAELVGRFAKNRSPLASVALTTDTSILTALGNDYGYETVFSRQLEAIGKMGDVLICISTSGESKNVIKAAELAKELGIFTIAFTGKNESELGRISRITLRAESHITAHIQESHICWGQLICGYAEKIIFPT
jgi:D-sedoheptulose 7-phosphate isomerase